MSTIALEELVREVPEDVLLQPCLESDIHCKEVLLQISQNTCLSPNMLGRWLHLRENDIQAIQHDNQTQPSCERIYLVLLKWINLNGSNATYNKLVSAFYKGNDIPTVESIISMIYTPTNVSTVRRLDDGGVLREHSGRISVDELKGAKTLPVSNGTPLSDHCRTPSTPSIPSFTESIQEETDRHYHPSQGGSELTMEGCPYKHHSSTTSSPLFSIGLTPLTTPSPPSPFDSRHPTGCPELCSSVVGSRPDSLTIPRNFKLRQPKTVMMSPFENMPKCDSMVGRMLQKKMNKVIMEHKEKAQAACLKHLQAQEQLDSLSQINQLQQEELSKTASRMRVAIGRADQIQSENFNLKQELELNQQLLGFVCGALELWKDEVHREKILTPIQQQLDSIVQSLSTSVPDSLKSIQRDYQKLLVERDELEKELNEFYSLYSDKQTQLQAIVKENERLESKQGSQGIEISQLKRKVCLLMGQCKKISEKNKELERKVAALELENKELESKYSELEKSRIVVVMSKSAAAHNSGIPEHGYMRSFSDGTYVEVKKHQYTQHRNHPFIKNLSEDLQTSKSHPQYLKEVEEDMEEDEDNDCCALDWIGPLNEVLKRCDDDNNMLLQGVENVETQLADFKLSQKMQQQFS